MGPPLYSSLIDRDQSHVHGHKWGRVTRCPALCSRGQSVTQFHYFLHVPQIETLSRIVIDSQTQFFIFLKGVFYNLVFIKQLYAETAVRASSGGGMFDHVNQTGTRTQVKGTPTNKKKCNSGQTARSTRRRKARLVRLRTGMQL